MVHYRAETLLYHSLECLRASDLDDFRVTVVDNGSREDLSWVERFDRRFRLISAGKNLGFAAANNLALRDLAGAAPWTLLLNPDAFVEPRTLSGLLAEVDRDSTIGAATCKVVRPWGAVDPACHRGDPDLVSAFAKQSGLRRLFPNVRSFSSYHLDDLDQDESHDIGSGTGAFLLIRTSVLSGMNEPLDERFFLYGEDLDLCRRIRAAGYRIRYVPSVSAVHVKGSGRIRDTRTTWHFHRAMWTYYRKWGRYRNQPLVLGPLAFAIAVLFGAEWIRNGMKRLLPARFPLVSLHRET
jgi:GT2 family glycosyltransferase